MSQIAFIDLAAQQKLLRKEIDLAIQKVLDHGMYAMGPEVTELEKELSLFCGAKHTISCSSGTDALLMPLMAKNIGPGDAVFVPTFTFCATGEVVALLGASPVFVDVHPDTFNIDPESLKTAIKDAKEQGLKPKAIIPVDLFGHPAEHNEIAQIAQENNLWVLDDACQGFGATYKNKKLGSLGLCAATSFFPAKPLGCYGDGGAVFTNDDALADQLKSIRVHGQNKDDKYDNLRLGLTGRCDSIQAAILLQKMKIFKDEIQKRQKIAQRYNQALEDVARVPVVKDDCQSVWAQYTLVFEKYNRDEIAQKLKDEGVPTACYYPKPLHMQTAYKDYPVVSTGVKTAEDLAQKVLSLPMHPYLDEETQDFIIEKVLKVCKS